jgi:hypothetical protein
MKFQKAGAEMNHMLRSGVTLLALLGLVGWGQAGEPKDKAAGKKAPVELRLTTKASPLKVEVDAQSLENLRKALKAGEKSGSAPPAQAVEVTVELVNNSDKDVEVWVSGDPTRLDLDLKGEGAVSVVAQKFFTRVFMLPIPKKLAAGKSYTWTLKSLQYGKRNVEKRAYFTQGGEYTLTASFTTAINPAPEGTKADKNGFGRITLTSEPIKIKVETK